MLLELNVQNFLIIDDLSVSFRDGFNVITGETGSGKSIILDCISIILGDRASPSYIRNGQDRAVISCVFKVKNQDVINNLYEKCFFESKNENLVIIKKIITKNGSKILLNEKPTTTSFISEISSNLIEINSQFEQNVLFFAKNYLDILDEFCNINKELEELKQAFIDYQKSKKVLEEKIDFITKIKQEEDYYNEILKEISIIFKANITNKEQYESLINKRDSFLINEKITDKIEDFYSKISNIRNSRKFDYLISDLENLQNIIHDKDLLLNCGQIRKMLEEISINIDTSLEIFSSKFLTLSFDKEELEKAEEIISIVRGLARKNKIQPEEIFDFQREIANKLSQIQKSEDDIGILQKNVQEKFGYYKLISDKISQIRKERALILEGQVLSKLEKLNMSSTRFKVFFEEKEPSENGLDMVTFKVSMNNGLELTSLNKCASGGEMSRFMLAFKTVFAEKNESSALIFDEIDTGVSGKVAFNIGREMKSLSKKIQIICITHNTQVAACADHHFLVAKKTFENSTKTALKELTEEEKIKVIAYMLSNGNINDDNIKNAKNLISEARN